MSTATSNLAPDNSTDAAFRAWGSGVSAQLAAMGLVQTGDTGQINWSTVTRPTAVSTFQGYEIWRFADALQSTTPVFIKIEYGSGPANANHPSMRITVSTGTNGAGTPTGNVSTAMLATHGNSSASTFTCVFSGSTNRFCMALFLANSTNTPACFSIERIQDGTGTDSNQGVVFWTAGSSNVSNWQVVPSISYGGAVGGNTRLLTILVYSSSYSITTAVDGLDTGAYPIFPQRNGVLFPPSINLCAYFEANITQFGTVSMTVYGATRTYYPLGLNTRNGFPIDSNDAGKFSVLMRYD